MKKVWWATLALLAVAGLALLAHFSASSGDLNRYNAGWTGTESFFESLDRHTTTEIAAPADLPATTGATLLVIAPDVMITTDDARRYREFVARGNTLFLADELGTGNALLRAIGSTITIRQENLSSLDRAYDDPAMVVAYAVNGSRFLPVNTPLLLDQPVSLNGGRPLVATTVFSWLNTGPDHELSAGEPLGRFTVMADEPLGSGNVVVLADPSVFINGMEDPGYGNALFRDAVAHAGPVIIDGYSSRVMREDKTGEFIHAARSNTGYAFAAAALLVAAVLYAWHRRIL